MEPLDEIDAYIGLRISHIRKADAMTQESLAQAMGMDLSSLRDMEAGRAKVFAANLLAASAALGVPVAALLPPDTR